MRFRQPASVSSLIEVALNYARIMLQVSGGGGVEGSWT